MTQPAAAAPLELALEALENHLGAAPIQTVERVDVEADGAFSFTLAGPSGTRWFRYADGALREVAPAEDPRVPLARRMTSVPEGSCAVLAYRPRRRIVVETGDSGRGPVSKGYRRRRSAAAARAHLQAETASSRDSFRVARLIDHRSEDESLRFERLEGERIRCLRSHAARFFAIGAALRGFQDAGAGDAVGGFGSREELAVVDRWASRVIAATGALSEEWGRERHRLEELLPRLPAPRRGLAHRDLHDGQLLETNEGPALLDFDLLCNADVALDPANLLVHLGLRALQEQDGADEDAATHCGEALLDGLDRTAEPGFWERLRFYQATTALRLSLVYRLRPRWVSLAPLLIALAGRCLDEL